MEISVGASETKSLDLKTVYKPEGGESKKRKNRREVAVVSRFQDVKQSKKIRPSLDDDVQVEETGNAISVINTVNAVNGDSFVGVSVGGDGEGVVVPKRHRGSGGRSKLGKSFGFDLNDSVEKFVKLKDEVSLQDEVNEGSGRGDGFAAEVVKLNGEIGVEDEVGELKDGMKEVMQAKVSGTENGAPVSSGSLGCKDEVVKLNVKAKRNNGKNMKIDGLDRNQNAGVVGSFHLAKGEGIDVVLGGKDSLSKRNGVKRKRAGSNVPKKVESLSVTELDPDDDLEQNAARMLSSRFDPSCTGFASKTTTLALLPLNEGSEEPMEAQDRVLRPRRHQKGKGTRKRRHFCEIHSADMDAHWFLNRKIKIFWPLDESWYYGLVNDYDAEKNLHHIKYDDRDEEWISLENERFKLLLLPSELPRKPSEGSTPVHSKDEAFMESEPIISWLAHHRIKSSSSPHLKKQNTSVKGYRSNNGSEEGHIPIVYVRRRRHHSFSRAADDATCVLKLDTTQPSIPLIQCDKFEICIPLWPMLTYYVLGADMLWLVRSVFLLRFGTMVTMWPSVFLEVLFVDNIVGLRLFLFEGCLKQAVAFVFLVMKVFCEPQKDDSVNNQIPVTSIRFKLSFFQNFRNHKVFAYYSFSKVRDFDWRYLDSEFQPHCLLSKHLSLSECTYDNIKELEAVTQTTRIPYAAQTEVFHKKSNRGGASLLSSSRSSKPVPGLRTIYGLRHGNVPPFALSFTAAPNLFLGLHLKLLLERSISLAAAADADDEDDDDYSPFETSSESSSSHESHLAVVDGRRRSSTLISDANFNEFKTPSTTNLKGIISVEIPTSDEAYRAWNNLSDGIICSPNQNPTDPKRSLWHHQKSFGEADFFGNGPKKRRTQVQYTLPYSNKNKGHNNLPYQRIRKTNDKKISLSSLDTPKGGGPRRNLELVACDANILINGGDKGWRECGARVSLEADQQKDWKLAVKCSGELRYAYKVHQDLQPGSTNRFTHAMMWKGGKDWALEFPERSQWFVFKELHEECHNRNIRAASIKNIPIPGVRLIHADDHQNHQKEECFTRTPWYLRQVRDDVEMAMDGSHVMYDMDSEDEEWVCRSRSIGDDADDDDVISDELFEKVMDMLEKVSYAQKRDHFTSGEVDELIARVTPMQAAKFIYDHWRDKRQRKGMALVRQLQPPLWEKYQQICREWEKLKPKPTTGPVSGSQEKASAVAAGDKPPMFAFCLKPRGLELLNRGSKHRPHKKISLSGHGLGDHDTHHSYGRRVHTYGFDERAESSDVSPMLVTKMYSPRDASMPGHFSLDGGDASDWNHQQLRIQSSKSIRTLVSPKQAFGSGGPSTTLRKSSVRRTNSKKFTDLPSPYRMHPSQQLMLGGSDLDEFRLRDASSAAKHARNMAKLKRERAQKLMLSADLAIHKAVSALMTAEAIKASCTGDDDDESTRSTSPPSRS